MKNFYTYVYLNPNKPGYYVYDKYFFRYEPFYVGKGKGKRAYDHMRLPKNCNKELQYIIIGLLNENKEPIIVINKSKLTEIGALKQERHLIKSIGRIKDGSVLVNKTLGGQGTSGYHEAKPRIVDIFTVNEIIKLRKEGYTINNISDILKLSVGVVEHWLLKNNLSYYDKRKKYPIELKILSKKLKLVDKKTFLEISKILNVPITTIKSWLLKDNIRVGKGGREPHNKISLEIKSKCIEMKKSNLSNNEISRLTNVSTSTLKGWFKGIQT